MSRFSLYSSLVAALTAIGLAAAVSANVPAFNGTVTQSSRNAFVVGSPDAKTKVVEYASYTCPHCGHFETDDMPPFKTEFVAGGNVSVEIRNYVRDPVDAMMALLARCGDPEKFFDRHGYLMSTQAEWMPRRANIGEPAYALLTGEYASKDAEYAAMKGFMLTAFAKMDVASMVGKLGLTVPQAKTCVADRQSYEKIMAMTEEAHGVYGFAGTPSFMINDTPERDVYDMATLRERLKIVMQ